MTHAELPILMNAHMVGAIIHGHKTQTRRVCHFADMHSNLPRSPDYQCPYGHPGDRLWVRETVAYVPATAYRGSGVPHTVNPADPEEWAIYRAGWDRSRPGARWRSAIHAHRWASRITLVITEVRVQRLQDISEDDARAEGVNYNPLAPAALNHRTAFAGLWDRLNAARGHGWEANPWVWVITFRREAPALPSLPSPDLKARIG